MNLVLVEPEELAADGTAVLRGRRATHVREVHRVQAGETLRAGVVNGKWGQAEVLEVGPDAVALRLELDRAPPPKSGIELLLAVPRPKILKRVLAAAASLGVGRIVLVNAFRVEKSYFGSPLLAPEAMRAQLLLGLEQGRDTVLPEVRAAARFKPFVEDELDAVWPAPVRRLVAHPTSDPAPPSLAATERCVVAVGPEGGWIPYEVEKLEDAGFVAFSLGPRILRVDTAVPYLAGVLDRARAPG